MEDNPQIRKLVEISESHHKELRLLAARENRYLWRVIDDVIDQGLKQYIKDQYSSKDKKKK